MPSGGSLGVVPVTHYRVCLENCYKTKGSSTLGSTVRAAGGMIELSEPSPSPAVLASHATYVSPIGSGPIATLASGAITGNIDGNTTDPAAPGTPYGSLIKRHTALAAVVTRPAAHHATPCPVTICPNSKILGCDSEAVSLTEKVAVGVLGKLGHNAFVTSEVPGGVDNTASSDNRTICSCPLAKDTLSANA